LERSEGMSATDPNANVAVYMAPDFATKQR